MDSKVCLFIALQVAISTAIYIPSAPGPVYPPCGSPCGAPVRRVIERIQSPPQCEVPIQTCDLPVVLSPYTKVQKLVIENEAYNPAKTQPREVVLLTEEVISPPQPPPPVCAAPLPPPPCACAPAPAPPPCFFAPPPPPPCAPVVIPLPPSCGCGC